MTRKLNTKQRRWVRKKVLTFLDIINLVLGKNIKLNGVVFDMTKRARESCKNRNILGAYSQSQNIIYLKSIHSLTILHELSHLVDHQYRKVSKHDKRFQSINQSLIELYYCYAYQIYNEANKRP